MFGSELQKIKSLGLRGCLDKGLQVATIGASCLMLWKGLALATNTSAPIVVVLSGSMEPAFYRGDLLLLTNFANVPYDTGDIVVYNIPGEEIPIVHRIIETHDIPNTEPLDQLLLTKGDNNPLDDIVLYRGEQWLKKSNVVGQVRGFLPYIGYATIAMNDFPWLKNVLLGSIALLGLLQGA